MSLTEAGFGGAYTHPAHRGLRGAARAAAPGDGWRARLEQILDAERGRWFLWLPVLFGCGIALYLGAPAEPTLPLAMGAFLCALALRLFFCATALRLIVSATALMVASGFLCAKLHALSTDAPQLTRHMRFVEATGWVERVEQQEKRIRLTIRLITLSKGEAGAMPQRVRISYRGKGYRPAPGEAVRLKATLMPPPEPALPGGFDFGRYYWFQGLGASGYVTGKVEPLADAPPAPLDLRLRAALAQFRDGIAARVGAVISGDPGAIAKALIMGERGEISEAANSSLRDSGLTHVISISGFHMALTAGTAFWLLRALLALAPGIALRFPIRIWAAVGALIAASLYLAISGWAVTAVRAYIMVAIMFAAIILNRPAISLRNLAIAALLILIVLPESLADAGFQMSFAATAVLIAYYESRRSQARFEGWPAIVALPLAFAAESAITTLLASAAVDPLAAYHFHRFAAYSVLGNLFAMPAVSFIVMPMALLSLLAMPFGLEAWPLQVMEFGLHIMLAVSDFVAKLPGAVIAVPAFSTTALTAMMFGGLWLVVWRGNWRYLGLGAVGVGLALAPLRQPPDIWVEREGNLVAVRGPDGMIATTSSRKATFSLERWMEADGDLRPVKEARAAKVFRCDGHSCLAMVKGRLVSHVLHPSALADDCRRADVLIAGFHLPESCSQPKVVIDLGDLLRKGAHTIRLDGEEALVRSVGEERGIRPWSPLAPRRETIPAVAPEASATDEPEGADK